MKKSIFCIILLIMSFCAKAQIEITSFFNDSHTGINQSLIISKRLNNKYEVSGGLKININRFAHPDNQGKIFYKRLYSTKPIHYIGGELMVNRYLFERINKVHPFLFYNIRLSYSTTRNIGYNPYGYSKYNEVLYIRYDTNFGPFTWLEQYVGLGYKIDFTESLFFMQKIGFGVDLIFGEEKSLNMTFPTWELCYIHSFGIGYRF
jgi:hypothetical protein